jgi:hypothetical protein
MGKLATIYSASIVFVAPFVSHTKKEPWGEQLVLKETLGAC